MKIIAVYNNKGGCAKTVTSVNLAYNLSSMGYRVLVVDMDPQGNASSFFRRYDLNKPSVKDFLNERNTLHQCIRRTLYKGLDIMPSNIQLRGLRSYSLVSGEKALQRIKTENKSQMYDYCIIDCPPSADFLIEAIMAAADDVIIPLKPERFSADGLGMVQEIIRDFGGGRLSAACLFTQYYKAKDTIKAIEYIIKTQQMDTYDNVIRRTSAVDHSVLVRRPLLKCASKSTAALDYMDFTKEYLEKEEKQDGIA